MINVRAISALVVALGLLGGGMPAAARDSGGASDLVGQASVVDGDTLDIHGTRVRLWGIDAPESSQLCTGADGHKWRCGAAAANRLSDFIARRPVTCRKTGIDRYQRVIAICTVGGQDLGQWAVANGWAFAFRRYSRDYVADERIAIAERRGFHDSHCQLPWEYRAQKRARGRSR